MKSYIGKQRAAAFVLGVLLALAGATSVAANTAKQSNVEVRGAVLDQTDALLVALPVTLVDKQGQEYTTSTDERGRYRFSGIPPGLYTLKVTAEGFAPYSSPVDLTKVSLLTIDVHLKVELSEQIEVTSERTTVSTEPDENLSATVLEEEDLDALPDDPDEMLDVLRMMAGASGGGDAAAIYVDGFSESDRLPPKDAILRVRINSNPFSAEYNEPGHGRIEIITKPGSDTVHGGFRMNFNDESLNARNAFAPTRAPLQVRTYGGYFSGPIIRNRWGFFLDADRREQDENDVVNATVLNPITLEAQPFAQTVLTPTRSTGFSVRTDFLATPKHTLGLRYRLSNRENLNQGLGSGFDLPERAFDRKTRYRSLRFFLTTIASERTVNEFRLQLSRRSRQTRAVDDSTAVVVLDAFSAGGNQGSLFSDDVSKELELSDNVTYSYGKHTLRFGLRAEGERNETVNRANFGGTFTFGGDLVRDSSGSPILEANGNTTPISPLDLYRKVFAGEPGYAPSQFSIVRGDPMVGLSQWEMAWFAQDDWRTLPRLTLSLGLRHEFQTNLADKRNLAPRFGLAWQADRGGKSTVRAGAGLFYDYVDQDLTLDTRRLDGTRQQQIVIQRPGFFTEIPAQLDGGETIEPAIRTKARDFRAPYSVISTVSYERLLPANLFLSAGYTWTRGVHLLRTRNINSPTLGSEGALDSKPFPNNGPILEYESTGLSIKHELWTSFRWRIGGASLFGRYSLSSAHSDTDGAVQTPANSNDLTAEWGRSGDDARHRLFFGGSIDLPWELRVSPLINISSGRPFNIRTGRDSNGDTLFSDRPAFASPGDAGAIVTRSGVFNPNPVLGGVIIPRNFGRGPGQVNVDLNISKTFGFGGSAGGRSSRRGPNQRDGSDVRAPVEQPRAGRGRWRRGGLGRGGDRGNGSGRSNRQKYSLTLSINMRNVINTVNPAGYNGVLTSAFFGKANRALAARRIEAALSFRF